MQREPPPAPALLSRSIIQQCCNCKSINRKPTHNLGGEQRSLGASFRLPSVGSGAAPLPLRLARNVVIRPGAGMTSCGQSSAAGATAAAGRWGAGRSELTEHSAGAAGLRPVAAGAGTCAD
nr:cAMP-dependent protein kinase inhibitor alpha isoform X1 [Macaca fascicularis]